MSRLTKLFIQLNLFLYRITGGLIGGHLGSATILLLTTTGRKSGKLRTIPLRYLRHGDVYMIAASNWGKPNPPAWFYNLQANPVAAIQVMNKRMTVRSEVADEIQHETLYQNFIEADKRFINYPKTANRTIPVVLLHAQP